MCIMRVREIELKSSHSSRRYWIEGLLVRNSLKLAMFWAHPSLAISLLGAFVSMTLDISIALWFAISDDPNRHESSVPCSEP